MTIRFLRHSVSLVCLLAVTYGLPCWAQTVTSAKSPHGIPPKNAAVAMGQDSGSKAGVDAGKAGAAGLGSASSRSAVPSKPVKAESVTINMPEGMTKDQADAILNELRQIRQLLEKQQTAAAAVPAAVAPAPPEKVSMSVGKGWYSIGSETAPVTIIEFADYQCPFCKAFHTATFADLKKNYVDTGKVRFVTRDLPLDFHQNALRAAEAARCAGDQGKFWEMRNALITNSTDLSQDAVKHYAQALSVEMDAFGKCLDGEQHRAEIQKDQADAGALQITGTPSFVIGRMKNDKVEGVKLVGAMPYATFDSKIKDLLVTQP